MTALQCKACIANLFTFGWPSKSFSSSGLMSMAVAMLGETQLPVGTSTLVLAQREAFCVAGSLRTKPDAAGGQRRRRPWLQAILTHVPTVLPPC